jgi:hypothetical protein
MKMRKVCVDKKSENKSCKVLGKERHESDGQSSDDVVMTFAVPNNVFWY